MRPKFLWGQQTVGLRSEHGTCAIGERGGGVAPWQLL
jgi:hypothetical protein